LFEVDLVFLFACNVEMLNVALDGVTLHLTAPNYVRQVA
jgi:hypothetical protein